MPSLSNSRRSYSRMTWRGVAEPPKGGRGGQTRRARRASRAGLAALQSRF